MKVAKQKRTGGFTLIELIVVIAILGILAGVGTVAYTGYVKAAHKGVDEQMISDVAYSMYLASYADPNFLEGEAYVVGLQYGKDPALKAVGTDKDTTGEAKLKNALEMSFGTGCTDNGTLALTYDGWKLGAVNGVLSLVSSSYHGKEGQLLGDIQTFTDSLREFLTNGRLNGVLNSTNSDYAKYLKSLGASTAQEVANATTLYLAQYAANKSDPEEYANWWGSGLDANFVPKEIAEAAEKFGGGEDDFDKDGAYDATGDIMMFYAAKVAAAEAAYQYVINNDGPDINLTEQFNAVRDADGLSSLMEAVTNFNITIKKKDSYQTWCDNRAANDAKAYIQCLNAINESSDSFSGNLSQQGGQGTGLYTDGKAFSMVTSYVNTAQALSELELGENSAAVAITVCKDSKGNIMVTIYKDGKAIGDTATVQPEEGELDFDNVTNEKKLALIGNKSFTMSVGETKIIELKMSVDTLNSKLGMEKSVYDWVVMMRNGDLGEDFASNNNLAVTVTTQYSPSGNDTVIVTLTVQAVSEGEAVITGEIYEGGYTVTVKKM